MNINTIILLLLSVSIVGYLIMINVIYFLAPTVPKNNFPLKRFGRNNCTRVADNPNRGEGMSPIITDMSMEKVQDATKKIINKMQRTKIVTDNAGFIHFVQITPLFRFHDDIFIKIFSENNKTNIWLQSQSRLGLHDLMVNERRVKHIYKELKKLT